MSNNGPPRAASFIGKRLTGCSNESMMYAICVAQNINNIKQGICQPQFNQLKTCFARALVIPKKK
eukprot:UN03696